MTETRQDFAITAGDHKDLKLTLINKATGLAFDLTGATVRWSLSRTARGTAIVAKATGGQGITVTDPAAGKCTVTLVPADTAALSGDYYHECEVTDSGGRESTVLTGTATVKPQLIQ